MQLSHDILYVFFCFSNFSQFHQVVAHFKVGALTMTIVEEEIKRAEKWRTVREVWILAFLFGLYFQELAAAEKSRELEEHKKLQKRFRTLVRKQDALFRVALYLLLNLSENPDVQYKMRVKGIVQILLNVSVISHGRNQVKKYLSRYWKRASRAPFCSSPCLFCRRWVYSWRTRTKWNDFG